MPPIDLPAYLSRISHPGDAAPTLDTLRALHRRHPEAIPFENLNPLLGRPVRLDPESLEAKLVRQGRGGYCYEHNLLFRHALDALGFRVTGLAARVLWNVPEGVVTPRTHMLLRVDLDGETWLADVGFGAVTLTAPLRLEPDTVQQTPHEPYRLLRTGDEYVVQTRLAGDWKPLYRFDLQPQHANDYEVANWFVSTHPRSIFTTGLMAARPDEDRRHTLRNNELTTYTPTAAPTRRTLTTPADLRTTLEALFHITLPDTPDLDAALSRLTTPEAAI